MINWDDIRIFLAVARSRSIRASADALNITHATVLRHIAQLEAQLSSQVFEKLRTGYSLTPSGLEILKLAEEMEALSHKVEARIFGRDQSLTGLLRVTALPSLATELLMPDFAEFAARYPTIELEISTSTLPANLVNRQSDVAIRVVLDRDKLSPGLVGSKLNELYGGVYISRKLLEMADAPLGASLRWLLKPEDTILMERECAGDINIENPPIRFTDIHAQIAATRMGAGIARLPCFVGDLDPDLIRVPGTKLTNYGTLWLLTQDETRKTTRARVFIDFIKERIAMRANILAGLGNM